MNWCYSY